MDKAMKIAVTLSAYDKMSTVINSAVDRAQMKLGKLKKGLSNFGTVGMLAGGAGVAFLGSTLKAAEENEIAVNRLNQVYKSMGQNAAQASKQSEAYASKLSLQIGVEDESILAVQAKLATFSKVSNATARMNGLMDRATAAAFDLGATGFGEASSNAVMLGKALQDPARGAMALAKAGALNKGDIPIIKQIQASKGLAAAQEFVLRAVEKQAKGVAAATAPASAKMKVAWSEVTESIGKQLLPAIEKISRFIGGTLMPKIQNFIEQNPKLAKVLGIVSIALLAVGAAAKVLSVIIATNPIVLLITAIAAAAYLIISNWTEVKASFARLWAQIQGIFSRAWKFIKKIFWDNTPAALIYNNWGKITAWFSSMWGKVKAVFSAVWEGIKNIFLNYTPHGLIYKHWDKITAYFTGIWDGVKKVFSGVWQWIENAAVQMYEAGKRIIKNLWSGIKNGFSDFFSADNGAMRKYEDAMQVAQNKTQRAIAFDTNSNVNVTGGGSPAGLRPSPVNNNNSTVQFAPVINYTGTGSPADVQAFGTQVQDVFGRQMKDYQAQQERKRF